jgi:hypothetical protein
MNWKLIFQLSLFGLAMAITTVYLIPSSVEPYCWLLIFIACAVIIARNCTSRYFLHGFCVSLVNCVWVTGAHVILYNSYAATHAKEVEMMSAMPVSPRLMMLLTGPIVGIVSGLVLGLFALIASRITRRPQRVA